MFNHTYRKPKHQVLKVFQGKALSELLGQTHHPQMAQGMLEELTVRSGGGNPVLIIEQYPLNSSQARGKFQELIYACRSDTGNQYSKKYAIPDNPRTPQQTANRNRFADAVRAWQGLTEEEKESYQVLAHNQPYSGYNLFLANYLKP